MDARRVVVALCLLISALSALTLAVHQYALIWWTGIMIAGPAATVIALLNREGRKP